MSRNAVMTVSRDDELDVYPEIWRVGMCGGRGGGLR